MSEFFDARDALGESLRMLNYKPENEGDVVTRQNELKAQTLNLD